MDTIPEPVLHDITHIAPPGSCASLHMLRLDAIHPLMSGNKWFKLKNNLTAARDGGYGGILTFGGPFSNHLHATAAACAMQGLSAWGIVRGEDAASNPSATLMQCAALGMHLRYVSREEYAHGLDGTTCARLCSSLHLYAIPEGGNNREGRSGAGEIARLLPPYCTHVCLPVGSGTTLAGILGTLPSWRVVGFTALRDRQLEPFIQRQAPPETSWTLNADYTFGGFARTTPELVQFMRAFQEQTGVPTDIVYTGKMMYGISSLLRSGEFGSSARIVCVHTGGLQGNPPGLFEESDTIDPH